MVEDDLVVVVSTSLRRYEVLTTLLSTSFTCAQASTEESLLRTGLVLRALFVAAFLDTLLRVSLLTDVTNARNFATSVMRQ